MAKTNVKSKGKSSVHGMTIDELMEGVAVDPVLSAQTSNLTPFELIHVTDKVYFGIGQSIANTIIFEGPQELLIIDSQDTMFGAQTILAAIREVTNKPVGAIVATHHHADHTGGNQVYTEGSAKQLDIWAHYKYPESLKEFNRVKPLSSSRVQHMYGQHLGDAQVNCGIGITLLSYAGKEPGVVHPNKFVTQSPHSETICGIELQLYHIPGETDDHLGVWWPEKKVFACGDDVYRSFPNLYTIRGAVARSPLDWIDSLDTMLSLGIEYLVPSHTKPIIGRRNVTDVLTAYKDAIQYVHDETVRLMNQRMHPDDIANTVKLPARLANHPYLIEYYGTVQWSVRAIYSYYMGWFSGEPEDLCPLTPSDRAQKLVAALGGVDAASQKAQEALDRGEDQWALELTGHVMRLNRRPPNPTAFNVRIQALKNLGGAQLNSCGRHWYLSKACEVYGILPDLG